MGVAVGRSDSDEDGADDRVALPVGERSVPVDERERGGVGVCVSAADSDSLTVGEHCKDSEAVGTAVSEAVPSSLPLLVGLPPWEGLRVAVLVGGPLESDRERFPPPALREDVPFSVGVALSAAVVLPVVVLLAASAVDGGGSVVVGASVAFEDGGSEGVTVSLLNPSCVLFVTLSLLVAASVAFASFGVVMAVLLPPSSAVVTLALTSVEVTALTKVSVVVLAAAVSFVPAAVPLVAFSSPTAVVVVLNSPAVKLSAEVALWSPPPPPPPVLDGSVVAD